jgi:hypothetical protein
MLAELAEIGMNLARDVARQAAAAEAHGRQDALPDPAVRQVGGGSGLDLALVFSRIARAVRQTVALEARLAADAEVLAKQGAVVQASRMAAERRRLKQQKDRVRRYVEDAISADPEAGDAEGLRLDLDERLEDLDIEAELGRRPIGVIVLGICSDLGVELDLRHFSDAELGFDVRPGRAGADCDPASPPTPGPSRRGGGERDVGALDVGALDVGALGGGADTGDPP